MISLLITLAFVGVAVAVYVLYIRPELVKHPRFAEMYEYAEGFWANLAARLRMYWDLIPTVGLIFTPEILDAAHQAFAAVDPTVLSPGWRIAIQGLGLLILIVKAAVIRETAKTVDGK